MGILGMNKGSWVAAVVVALAVVATQRCFSEANGQAGGLAIVNPSADQRVGYGVERLKAQLEVQGQKVSVTNRASTGHPGSGSFVVGVKSDPFFENRVSTAERGCKELNSAEGFLIRRAGDGQHGEVLIVGADEQGAMYGCLEAAEAIRMGEFDKWPDSRASAPTMKLRSYDFVFPSFVKGCVWEDNPHAAMRLARWFYDKDKVVSFLDKMAEAKFNTVKMDATHPFPAIVAIPGYPEAVEDVWEETPLTSDKLKNDRIPYLRWLFGECRRRGITPYVAFFNAWIPDSVAKAHQLNGATDGVYHTQYPEPEAEAYTRACIKAFGDTHGDLAGLFIWNVESVPQGSGVLQNQWLKKAIIDGLLESAHRPPCILAPFNNALTDDRAGMEAILKSYPQLRYISADTDGENTTAPGIESAYFDQFKTYQGVGGVVGGMLNANLGGWGSGNIEPYPWFSFDFLKKMMSFLVSKDIVGSTSFPMRGEFYPDCHERDWLWLHGLGRFLWDGVNLQEDYFTNLVQDRYGCSAEAAQAIMAAYEKASEIPVLFVSQFYYGNCTARCQFGATLEYGIWPGDLHVTAPGMLMVDSPVAGGNLRFWVKPQPHLAARKKLVDIVEYVKNDATAETTPDRLAEILEADAKECLAAINKAAPEITRRREEFQELQLNMQAYHYMGLHLSEKTRALLDMLRFLKNGDNKLYVSGKARLQKSLDYFMEQRAVSRKIYPDPNHDNLIFQVAVPAIPIDWDNIIPVMQDEIANYDQYLVRMTLHMVADRNRTVFLMPGPTIAEADLFLRVAPLHVKVWHTWWGEHPEDYWNNTEQLKRYWSKAGNTNALLPAIPTQEGLISAPVNPKDE